MLGRGWYEPKCANREVAEVQAVDAPGVTTAGLALAAPCVIVIDVCEQVVPVQYPLLVRKTKLSSLSGCVTGSGLASAYGPLQCGARSTPMQLFPDAALPQLGGHGLAFRMR